MVAYLADATNFPDPARHDGTGDIGATPNNSCEM
jgi:hypothetical protein